MQWFARCALCAELRSPLQISACITFITLRWLRLELSECIMSVKFPISQKAHVFMSHLSSVASQIESREVIRVACAEVDDIHQVGRNVHNCRGREGITQYWFKTHQFCEQMPALLCFRHTHLIRNFRLNWQDKTFLCLFSKKSAKHPPD